METIYLEKFLEDGIVKEKTFRVLVNKYDWTNCKNKKVLIKGCSSVPIPTWAYLIIAAKLTNYAKAIYYGEKCSAVKIS